MSKRFFVEIVKDAFSDQPEEVAKRMGPMSKHRAEKVDDGANINLNHDEYFTRIVDTDGD